MKILSIIALALASQITQAEGQYELRTHHVCSSNMKKPTIVKMVSKMSQSIAKKQFKTYYKDSSPKASFYQYRDVTGVRVSSVVKNKRTGRKEVYTCFFAASSGKIK